MLFGDFPPPPKIPNVLVYPLGDAEPGRQQREGRRYNTITQRYALVPQRSGLLRLPPQSFAGAVRVPEGAALGERISELRHRATSFPSSPFPSAGPRGVLAPGQEPHPRGDLCPGAGERSGRSPLGTNPSPPCRGHCGVRLTPLPAPSAPGLRTYDSQTALEEARLGSWLQAEQRMVTVLMPEQAGALRLPTLSLPWWDTQADELRYATLPGAQLRVAEGALAALPLAPASPSPQKPRRPSVQTT